MLIMTSPQLNLEDIYNELNTLLKDVCSFLNSEVQNGTLSTAAQKEAHKLVSRSLKQVEVISTIAELQENSAINYPYLQMQRPNIIEEGLSEYVDADNSNHYESDVYEESYDQIDVVRPESFSTTPTLLVNDELCPYEDLSSCILPERSVKYGPLSRKERYLLFEQKKQLMAGLIGYWLLIYPLNKKEAKPVQTINLTDYRAKAVEQKKDPIFEIFAENKKSYEFIARSPKDMDQWVVAINCKKQPNYNIRNLPQIPSNVENVNDDSSSENNEPFNDTITSIKIIPPPSPDGFDSDGDIYENLDELNEKIEGLKDSLKDSPISPKLPPRQPVHYNKSSNTNVAEYNNIFRASHEPKVEEYEEENTYDPVQNGEVMEDEEEIYDELKDIPLLNDMRKTIQNNNYDNAEDEDCSYDIPGTDDFTPNQLTSAEDEYEEEVEYDELRIEPEPSNDKSQNPQKLIIQQEEINDKRRSLTKPAITSPKPKFHMKFTRKSDSSDSSQAESSNRIHNIIQQMEASLSFKDRKN